MTTTKVWRMADEHAEESIAEAAELLRRGELVAFPTETVYGLGADARSSEAVAGIFQAKGRPSDNPLIVHIANISQLDELVLPYSTLAKQLMGQLWPGPLTLVLPVQPGAVSPLVTAGLSTVGVRMPSHPVALRLLAAAGCPVAAPSANRSGRPSPTLAEHVAEDLSGRISGIVDGGATGIGLESTVIELTGEQALRILRPGGVTVEQLREAAPQAEIDAPADAASAAEELAAPRSPGMKYTHYAPKGELSIVQGSSAAERIAYMQEQVAQAANAGLKAGVLVFDEQAAAMQGGSAFVLTYGSGQQLEQAAHRLYAALRQFDAEGVQRIWAEGCEPDGIGAALMNRLLKAAGHRTHQV
ncbi:L-threonylcarbamoyladenylate synthase [Paenibacillus algorifonticola]|uniref:Threonylcarbamoyl-AMP synthase n=1 Tax=Paenibacillus algorifonticola TaxID=684063 RepID=A0A1I2GDC2_9BACL|nr:L-threonylcarbamoyladenylate synthase [Paenibacillus algorifonticola]SFF15183.1 L-threonylcarbamoyladenylate synthase [Paenibacillus algorifonticola]